MTSAHHHPHSTFSLPPPPPPPLSMQSEFKLPSLKDLNFQYRSPASGTSQDAAPLSSGASTSSEHGSQNYSSSRRDWSRPASAATSVNASLSHSQHSPQPPVHEQQQQQQHQHHPQKQTSFPGYPHDTAYFTSPIAPQSHPVSASQGTRDDPHHSNKRPRSATNTISNSPAHSPHAAYPPPPYPTSQPNAPPFHQHHPHPAPLPHDQVHHVPPYHGGYPYSAPYVQQRQPLHMPPHAHPHAQHQLAPAAYTQPPGHWPAIPPPPPIQQQHTYAGPPHFGNGFHRTTALVPTNLDPRPAYPPNADMSKQTALMTLVSQIAKNCKILYDFASRYAQLQASLRHVQPRREELVEMTQCAANVVRLLEDLKRIANPGSVTTPYTDKVDLANSVNGDDHRPPKRPWEEISKDGGQSQQPQADTSPSTRPAKGEKSSNQTIAEKDMEIIRSKRASTTGNNVAGQPKSKYRKRSRASPPGKCHSCNIRETPEWRRGPDGARTLCNACGLHYAKLMRKQDKHPDGKPITIDLQTLRASTVQARGGGNFSEKTPPQQQKQELSPRLGHQKDEDTDGTHTGHGQSAGGKVYPTMLQNTDVPTSSPPPPSLPLPSTMASESGLPAMPPPWVGRGSNTYGDHPSHPFRANPPR